MTWTHFWDMHSGGDQKLNWSHIYIEAPEKEAKAVFYNRFHRNPERVTCTCCGPDYAIYEKEIFDGSETSPETLVISAGEIDDDEYTGHIPDEGYIWAGGEW